jgi:hypothetical protein
MDVSDVRATIMFGAGELTNGFAAHAALACVTDLDGVPEQETPHE